jgi:hypothetical protein
MSLHLAHQVISPRRGDSVVFGQKRTSVEIKKYDLAHPHSRREIPFFRADDIAVDRGRLQ